jgi:putative two-component system response regulator
MDVLVVDDEECLRQSVSYTLRSEGYRVTTACNGREAMEILRANGQQLVVSDWNMPGMNGLELCRAVREADLRRYVYFILLTSHKHPLDTLEGLSAGADDYVTKPFHPRELILRVNTGRRIISVESRDMTIFALAKLAESRDPETGEHLERVRGYCWALASRLQRTFRFGDQVDQEFIRTVYETCPLHDIGKVAIPDAILLKPGRLTEDEFEVMKTHTLHGADTLAAAIKEFPNAGFLRMAHDIALTHHERYDGTGYPQRLAGHQIPLCGRIMAVADVYDALTSKRVYKDAFSHETAKSIIVNDRGQHFDPIIVDAFLEIEHEFLAIRAQYAEEERENGFGSRLANPQTTRSTFGKTETSLTPSDHRTMPLGSIV